MDLIFKILLFIIGGNFIYVDCFTPVRRGCDERSCYPATGNLLIGRQDKLSSTSTCGLNKKERYCILSHLDQTQSSQKCFWCDSTPEGLQKNPRTSHRVQNIVYRSEPPGESPANQYLTWWQAENGVENVTIQLDLEAEFHVTHLIITYKTFRPAAMYIEKSYDWGNTWKITRYFASDCQTSFPGIFEGSPRHLDETVCQSRYSMIVPSTLGTVIYRVLPPNVNLYSPELNPYSKEIQDLLKITNLRIRMTKLHTLGDENIETDRREIKEKYYFSIYDLSVRGSCSCYGHAEKCSPEKEEHKEIVGMIHGKCDCTHNTMGNNCEYCLPDHNDLPWRPATGKAKNECKKCNCNDHALTCYFNPSVFIATGNLTGGVCDNCTHFTEGRQCDSCKSGYFQDPELALNHPEICKPCDCEPDGTVDEGLCDQRTDEEEDLVAGQCHCKTNVDGSRCDRCKNGFWNYTLENVDGCQACMCNFDGIVSNDGCDQLTGECTCKRFVVGRDCDQCLTNHYGLSSTDPNGCRPCDCDPGGSYDNLCDVTTGQCKCRVHVVGRSCDEIEDEFYSGSFDFLLFEGEYSIGSVNPPTTHIRREPTPLLEDTTWSGTGFMKVYEGSTLTFDVPEMSSNGNYDLVIRYEHTPNFPNEWTSGTVEVNKTHSDKSGEKCNGDDIIHAPFSLPSGVRFETLVEGLCLEEFQQYKIIITFDQYNATSPDSKANILIDAITLIPSTDSLEMFQKPEAEELKKLFAQSKCQELYMSGARSEKLPELCNNILKSISMFAFEGGLHKECNCDRTGSESILCDKYSGQCPCKKNVDGRKCDRCMISYFGFSADGCQPCNCNSLGSLDPFCRQTDGQCTCTEKAYGRRCNLCQPGFWNFPSCQPCECNGHATTCNPITGECINCRDSTHGSHCEVCLDGYYGDPTLGASIPCRECPCPNTKANGHSFADSCFLNKTSNEPVCDCHENYAGPRCATCNDNFFGYPDIPGGSCVPCNCSSNWNFNDTGNCDLNSGKCLKCLFNTEGDNCQFCKLGFFGDAVNDHCKECSCDFLGTDRENFDCNIFTGECNCLPNVEGNDCSRCIANHWRIASGLGCDPCDCDLIGSTSESCNEFNGKCECKEGFGGRKCDQCEENYFGNPQVECYPCDCNPDGSQSFQCHHLTGECICLEGIGGKKCDQCDVGFVQEADLTPERPVLGRSITENEMPQCLPCGECFTNWERILNELKNQTYEQIAKVEMIKHVGSTAAYASFFEDFELNLKKIREILDKASITNEELVQLQENIDAISTSLQRTVESLGDLDSDFTENKQSILQVNSFLDMLNNEADRLKQSAQNMKEKITKLQESNVEGALNLTQEAKKRSDEAVSRLKTLQNGWGPLSNAESQQRATYTLLNNSRISYDTVQSQNQEMVEKITAQIENLQEKIPELNKQLCGGSSNSSLACDELCGGAGCGFCGGLVCLNGALSKAESAVKSLEETQKISIEKDRKADQVLREVTKASRKVETAFEKAQGAQYISQLARNRSTSEMVQASNLTKQAELFSYRDRARPGDIKLLFKECMNAELQLDSNRIEALAGNIQDALVGIENVDELLEETSNDVFRATRLKNEADRVRDGAALQLDNSERVIQKLFEIDTAQNVAENALQAAQKSIENAKSDLSQIETDLIDGMSSADFSVLNMQDLAIRGHNLRSTFIKSQSYSNISNSVAKETLKLVSSTNSEWFRLTNELKSIVIAVKDKTGTIVGSKNRALDLHQRANNLANSAINKLNGLKDLEKEFQDNEDRLEELSNELNSLNCQMQIHLLTIEKKHNFFRICTPSLAWQPDQFCKCDPGSANPTC